MRFLVQKWVDEEKKTLKIYFNFIYDILTLFFKLYFDVAE